MEAQRLDDITPADLGNDYHLVFQEGKTDKNQVRAVVKAPDGSIFLTGPVVERARAFVSRLDVLFRPERVAWMGEAGEHRQNVLNEDEMDEAVDDEPFGEEDEDEEDE